MGLRVWFFVAISSLATAYVLAGKVSVLPGLWRALNVALIGLVGIVGAIGLGAHAGVLAGVALVVVVLVEAVGLWLGMARRKAGSSGGILVLGGTLCVLFASIRIVSGAAHAATSSESLSLAELLTEGVLRPLLILLGAVALG